MYKSDFQIEQIPPARAQIPKPNPQPTQRLASVYLGLAGARPMQSFVQKIRDAVHSIRMMSRYRGASEYATSTSKPHSPGPSLTHSHVVLLCRGPGVEEPPGLVLCGRQLTLVQDLVADWGLQQQGGAHAHTGITLQGQGAEVLGGG